jgi:predicted RNA binding protein YcfA (HicA-like mRNA interferase family)
MSPLSDRDCEEIRGVLTGKATGYTYDQVANWLLKAGWKQSKNKGGSSHRVWKHPSGRRVLLVDKGRGAMLPVYTKRAAKAIIETGGCKP